MGSRTEQDRTHRGSHPRTYRTYIRADKLHGIIDAETGRDRSSRRIEIQGYVPCGIIRRQKKELGLHDIGDIVINRDAEEDDAVHHKTAEHIHRSHIQLSLLYNGRIDICIISRTVTMHGH